jgi:hypothetical protein
VPQEEDIIICGWCQTAHGMKCSSPRARAGDADWVGDAGQGGTQTGRVYPGGPHMREISVDVNLSHSASIVLRRWCFSCWGICGSWEKQATPMAALDTLPLWCAAAGMLGGAPNHSGEREFMKSESATVMQIFGPNFMQVRQWSSVGKKANQSVWKPPPFPGLMPALVGGTIVCLIRGMHHSRCDTAWHRVHRVAPRGE